MASAITHNEHFKPTHDLFAQCDTTACIAGWAMCLWSSEIDTDSGGWSTRDAGQILDLNPDQADALFFDMITELDTAEKAAAHLRKMVAEAK